MKTETGYLTALINTRGSGLARVVFRSNKIAGPDTQFTTTYVESGFGVRQIVDALGVEGQLCDESAGIRCNYTIDDMGLLASVEPLLEGIEINA